MAGVNIDIPQVLIEDIIRAEIARAMPNKEKLIEAVIQKAMNEKKDTYSSTPTHFQQAVNDMIRETAKEIFREWLLKHREDIKKALLKYLNENKQKRLTEIAEGMAKNINAYGINVSLSFKE